MTVPSLSGRAASEVAVVGGGPAALLLARELQSSGARVCLVHRPDAASTGPGVALPVLAEHYSTLLRDLGPELAPRWWDLAREGAEVLRRVLALGNCEARRGGALLLAANEAEYREMVESLGPLGEAGFSSRMMGEAAASNYLCVEAGRGAMYVPGALVFDAAAALAALLEELQASGALVVEADPLRQVSVDPDGVLLSFDQGEVRSEVAVLGEGCALGGVPGASPRWVFPLRGQCLATGPVRVGMTHVTVAASANRGHEVYRDGPEGGMLAAGINPGSGPREATDVAEVDEVFQGHLAGFLRARFPEARRAEVSRRWAAVYQFSVDGLPLVGTLPGQARVHLLAGFGASPWSLAAGAAVRLARILAGGESVLPRNSSPRRLVD